MGDAAPKTKYLVVNGDEMEPGTFKDRLLVERDPHQLVEGVIISAYAIEATVGYIFLRGEYHLGAQRLQQAIAEAYDHNYLGKNILGSDYSLDLYLHSSAGRYICGEETALLNSLEGKRANPRAKPPFPQISGLWGKPTVVNNVETLCNVPHILHYGVEWYQNLGRGGGPGHQAVRCQRACETAWSLGVAYGHADTGDSRGVCRRDAGRLSVARFSARRRLDRFHVARTS